MFVWSGGDPDAGGPPGRDEPLASDRPDFTEASTTVGRGVVQVETGYTYVRDNADGVKLTHHSFPETLFRVGIGAEWLELRLAYNHGIERIAPVGVHTIDTTGADDLYLGAKLGLTAQHGVLPEMALMPQMTVPTGHSIFTADDVLPGCNWLYGWDVTDWLSTAGSTQINKGVDDDGTTYYEVAQSWTVGYSILENIGAYTEFFAFFPSGASTAEPEYYFDGGFTFSLTNDVQLDVRGGTGLNGAATDYFVGSGAVFRF